MVGGRSVPLIPSIVERVRSGPEQSRARRLLARRSATLDGEDRCETITEGRKEPLSNSAYPLQSPNSPQKKTSQSNVFTRHGTYPRTLIFENDSTARLGVGRPIDNAGRNVVKISIRFTCGNTSFDAGVSERMR